jgi:hypothetical protein
MTPMTEADVGREVPDARERHLIRRHYEGRHLKRAASTVPPVSQLLNAGKPTT